MERGAPDAVAQAIDAGEPQVVYGANGHTSELVSIYARGPASAMALLGAYEGAMNAGTRLIDNTHVHQVMLRFLGLDTAASVRPGHVILIIGDGMNISHEVAGSRFLFGTDDGLSFQQLEYRNHVTTWDVTTYDRHAFAAGLPRYDARRFDPLVGYDHRLGGVLPSLAPWSDSAQDRYFLTPLPLYGGDLTTAALPATDSAAAATALATGIKTDDGNIAWLPGDRPGEGIPTLAEKAKAAGLKIGVASTVPFSHATPAAFVAHQVWRGNYRDIAAQILHTTQPHVVMGGGHPDFVCGGVVECDRELFVTRADLAWARDSASGWVVAERTAGQSGKAVLDAAALSAKGAGKHLLAVFGGLNGNFEFHRPVAGPNPGFIPGSSENPMLKELVTAGLDVLADNNERGFFALFEQGDIDWANHTHNYENMLSGIYDLNEAVTAAVTFVDRDGDDVTWDNTLLIVTADHSNSYMRLNPVAPLSRGELPTRIRYP